MHGPTSPTSPTPTHPEEKKVSAWRQPGFEHLRSRGGHLPESVPLEDVKAGVQEEESTGGNPRSHPDMKRDSETS